MSYQAFLKSKVRLAKQSGLAIEPSEVNARLKPHQRAAVIWNVRGGQRADFLAFGLGKSVIQLETARLILSKVDCEPDKPNRALIVVPLNVRAEFIKDAVEILEWTEPPKFIRSIEEAGETGIYLTNYETVRDGKLDPRHFTVACLDEADVLRGLGGSKTYREFMRLFTGDAGPAAAVRGVKHRKSSVPYRFVATATPSPNDYIELLAYAEYLGIMDVSQAKTRFFKRDSTDADNLTLHPHKVREFWLWVSSWALYVQKPSDITGNVADDKGYDLPELDLRWHELPTNHAQAGFDRDGQTKMFRDSAIGVRDAAAEKRNSLSARLQKVLELRAEAPDEHRIIWHDLEAERAAIENAMPECVSIYGNQDLEEREACVARFSNGEIPEVAAKPVMLGSGCNLQRHCAWAIYMGIGFKFKDFIQSIHRLRRFLQTRRVRIDLIYTEAERRVRKSLETKWRRHNEMVAIMTGIIKEFGLSHVEMAASLTRKMGVERVEVSGANYRLVNNDSVLEFRKLKANSAGLVLTSIPFTNQYEYSPNFADFGHTETPEQFFKQMDFLTPNIFRVLQPGRIAAIHVKDRIVPGGLTGLGFQTVYPFHVQCIEHFTKHGFGYTGMKTIVTDVVRENNQTYRLGYSEMCKDASKMGVGMPEYLLYFRKPQSSSEKSYADIPVTHGKDGYSLSRWQVEAHGFTRSSGNRLLTPEELVGLKHSQIFKLFKRHSLENVYNFEHHVKLGDALAQAQMLPVTFMLLQPQSWHDDVWTDITRMLTLNGAQSAKGKEMHLCPMQFDIADRSIEQLSNPGDLVVDPFGGLMTVPYRAILKGRRGFGCELSKAYFLDGCHYCKMAEEKMSTPELFDVAEVESEAA